MDIIQRAIMSPWGWMYAAGRSHIDRAVASHFGMVEAAGLDPGNSLDRQQGHDLWMALISIPEDQRAVAREALDETVRAASQKVAVPARVMNLVDEAAQGDEEVASVIGNLLLTAYDYARVGKATVGGAPVSGYGFASGYVIERVDQGGGYVSKPGSASTWTKKLQDARIWPTREAAQRELCVENERIVPLSSLLHGTTGALRFGFPHRRRRTPEAGAQPPDRPVLDTRGNDIRIGDQVRDLGRNEQMVVIDVVQERGLSPVVVLQRRGNATEVQRTTRANSHYELIDDFVIRLPRQQTAGRRRQRRRLTAGVRPFARSRQY